MANNIFLRNNRAGEQLELFLVSAITSVLLVRFYLYATDYPQIGGDGLHIAHMLWGGFLMLSAMVLCFAFIGYRVQRLAAFIGGIGFGVFIDELGKFITHDNNYFFQPTIGLIYAIFVILFLLFRALSRNVRFTSKEYVLNALDQMEEAVLGDMDTADKQRVEQLLQKADTSDPLVVRLKQLLAPLQPTVSAQARNDRLVAVRQKIDHYYSRLLNLRYTNRFVKLFFIIEAIIVLGSISILLANTFTDILRGYGSLPDSVVPAAIGEVLSAGAAAVVVLAGVLRFRDSRLRAYELFLQATIIQIFLTTFFMFYRDQFGALPAFLFHVVLFITLRSIIEAERRLRGVQPTS